jgi:hypothetical protein
VVDDVLALVDGDHALGHAGIGTEDGQQAERRIVLDQREGQRVTLTALRPWSVLGVAVKGGSAGGGQEASPGPLAASNSPVRGAASTGAPMRGSAVAG